MQCDRRHGSPRIPAIITLQWTWWFTTVSILRSSWRLSDLKPAAGLSNKTLRRGTTYQGVHEPLVTRECWNRVQEPLDARAENKTRKVKHDSAFSGLDMLRLTSQACQLFM